MNFLAHHFFYANENPHHNTGLILPDWSRSAEGKRKLEWQRGESSSPIFSALWEGCQKHYEADFWFHDCAYFIETTAQIEADLAELQLGGLFHKQRKWFLAHILSEVLLDRLIIETHPDALERFYRDLSQVPLADIKAFLLVSGKDGMGNFEKMHHGFISSEFLRHYHSNQGITESLNRVVQRTKQSPFSDEEHGALTEIMPKWIYQARKTKKPLQMERL